VATERNDHLSAEGIQAFLESELPKAEAALIREHLSSCARCEAEVEAFRLLFAELGELPELAPSEHFAERVMGELPGRLARPLVRETEAAASGAGFAGWLRARLPGARSTTDHPPSGWLQDYVEGVAPRRQRTRVEAHLAACSTCETEAAEWRNLFGRIEALPEFAPSGDFGERVMARVRIPEPAATPAPADPLRTRAVDLARRIRPKSRRGWAIAGGIAMAPGVALATVGYLIMAHPLLTFGYLAAFLWWQVSGALSAFAGGFAGWLMENVTTFQAYSAVEALLASPAIAALSLLTLGGLMLAALWIVYRNLILTPTVAGHDAR
jgi:anti-sigma factor RsiW